jgi:hypothetical protein
MAQPIQHTIRYKTYLKQSVVEALEAVFEVHPDNLLKDTKIRLQNSFYEVDFPTLVINYQESEIYDAGIGHYERKQDESGAWYKQYRKLYKGNLVFTISALSSLDRDLISDAFVETVMMSKVRPYTNFFLTRIYDQKEFERMKNIPIGSLGMAHYYNLINLMNQSISPGGESAVPAPWGAEDVLVYQTSYSIPTFGEVISLPPVILYNLLSQVNIFPYVGGVEPVPTGTVDPALWVSDTV